MAKLTETTGERRFTLELSEQEARYLSTVLAHVSVEGTLYDVDMRLFDELHNAVGTLDSTIDVDGGLYIKDTE